MQVIGYSERGIVNALFHEIGMSQNSDKLLGALVQTAEFPLTVKPNFDVVTSEVLLEQSFSQFGTADAVLLIDNGSQKISVFVEAKVRAAQRDDWTIDRHYNEFVTGTKAVVNSSNLFAQLYHKVELVEALGSGGISALQSGIRFPSSSSRPVRKIGSNSVVRKAVEKVHQHKDATYYLAIVPDNPTNLNRFYKNELAHSKFAGFTHWDVSSYGYLTWAGIADFCLQHRLDNTSRTFLFNKDQIY